MQLADILRLILPAGLACLVAWLLDWGSARKGLTPPGFAVPWRRALAFLAVAGVLWIGVTLPLGTVGKVETPTDFSKIATPQLFLLHFLMVAAGLAWFLLGFAGVREPRRWAPLPEAPPEPALRPDPALLPVFPESVGAEPAAWTGADVPAEAGYPYAAPAPAPPALPAPPAPASLGRRFAEQFGLVAPNIPREIGIGVLLGIGAWVVVIVVMMTLGVILLKVSGEDALPKSPPEMVIWIAALPILVRMAISLSAGVVEEWFFRSFLQPRVGILLSTSLFVLAHLANGPVFMLVGIAVLSLIYALLVRWRQNIWPAMAAHALFDGVQLLVVIPGFLKLVQSQAPGAAALLGFW